MKKIFLACLTMCAIFAFTSQESQAQDIVDFRKTKIQKVETGVNPVAAAKVQAKQDKLNGKTSLLRRAITPSTSGKVAINNKKIIYRSLESKK